MRYPTVRGDFADSNHRSGVQAPTAAPHQEEPQEYPTPQPAHRFSELPREYPIPALPRLPPVLHLPFRRGVEGDAAAHRSSGLGLFVVRRIAEAHGGEVTVDSAPGRGTTFTVSLPQNGGKPEPGVSGILEKTG